MWIAFEVVRHLTTFGIWVGDHFKRPNPPIQPPLEEWPAPDPATRVEDYVRPDPATQWPNVPVAY